MLSMSAQNLTPVGYVDLGLPSGTLWKTNNEKGLFDHDAAESNFGTQIPTIRQWEELMDYCTWIWTGRGYKVIGPSGGYIVLPALGMRDCEGNVSDEGVLGDYWSETDGDVLWEFIFDESDKIVDWSENPEYYACQGHSVRLIK